VTETSPLFSVVVPTRGEAARLSGLLEALERQTLPRARFEILVAFDGLPAAPALAARLAALGARVIETAKRGGPGAARNRGATAARGTYLAFTEDDVVPAPDWLERAAARLEAEPATDVLEGLTLKPGGRPVHRQAADRPLYLPTNLFVRRALFERVGGYHEAFFAGGVYFREDTDLGFTLEEAGATVAREPQAVVTHPAEHARWLDPLRWARRHELDALLAARHPALFRERVEVHRLGPVVVRRPIARASVTCVLALAAALLARLLGERVAAAAALGIAALAFLPVWAKWRFDPLRLPVFLLVPFALSAALLRGALRQARARASRH
jgi:glycosyltransferase involved in cell wall biosynthesis